MPSVTSIGGTSTATCHRTSSSLTVSWIIDIDSSGSWKGQPVNICTCPYVRVFRLSDGGNSGFHGANQALIKGLRCCKTLLDGPFGWLCQLLLDFFNHLAGHVVIIEVLIVRLQDRSAMHRKDQFSGLEPDLPPILVYYWVLWKLKQALHKIKLLQDTEAELLFGSLGMPPKRLKGLFVHLYVLHELRGNSDPNITVLAHPIIPLVISKNLTSCIRCQCAMFKGIPLMPP